MKKRGKKDFLMAYRLEPVFDKLSDEQAGQLIKATFDYEVRREEPTFEDEKVEFAFETNIKPQADENMEAYLEECEKQRNNVKKRWDKSKKNTTEYDGKNGIPKIPMNTTCTDIDIDNDNDKSLSISTECQSETEKIVRDFSQVIGKRKISVKKRFELMSKYKEMRAEKPKEEVDQALLDYLAQE